MTIMFQLISFQLVFIQVYASFYLVFHKGGENSHFIFQLVFGLPLISTPILYDEKYLQLVSKCLFVYFQLVLRNFKFLFLSRKLKMFWWVLPICKGSLTSLLHIDSCWVYPILRSLTTLLYAIHVCKGSFTSPLMHCILWLCELGLVILSSCNAYM